MPEQNPITRRRAITVIAGGIAALLSGSARARGHHQYEWHGTALGADARIILSHTDRSFAEQTVRAVCAEIERLENIFSLFRPHSAVCLLNRSGVLYQAPLELVDLTRRAGAISAITGGAFDITVQPLWELYATHFRLHPSDTVGPPPAAIEAVRQRIGQDRVRVDGTTIRLAPGTRLTFNGIAQGYITDRVTDLLKSRGWDNVLIDVGEIRALGEHPDGRFWQIELPSGGKIAIADASIATSEGRATRFTVTAPQHHLFDPRSGLSAPALAAVSVIARSAADADALSTALFVAPESEHYKILHHFPGARRAIIS